MSIVLSSVITLISLVVVLVKIKDSFSKGFLLGLFFIMVYPKRVFFLSEPLSATRLLLVVLISYLLLCSRKFAKRTNSKFLGYLIFFCVVKGFSALWSNNPIESLVDIALYSFEILSFYVVFFYYIESDQDIDGAMKILFLAVVIPAILGMIERFLQINIVDLLPRTSGRELMDPRLNNNIASTYDHPILFGIALSFGWVIGLYYFSFSKSIYGIKKVMIYIAFLCIFANLYFTGSRGPWIATLLGFAIVMLFSKKAFVFALQIATITAIVLVVNPNVYGSIEDLVVATFDPASPEGGSFTYRFLLAKQAFLVMSQSIGRILIGYGDGAIQNISIGTALTSTGHYTAFRSWDSEIIIVAFENGILGLSIILLLFLNTLIFQLKNIRKAGHQRKSFFSSILAIQIMYLFMLTNVAIFTIQIHYFVWGTLALSEIKASGSLVST